MRSQRGPEEAGGGGCRFPQSLASLATTSLTLNAFPARLLKRPAAAVVGFRNPLASLATTSYI
jgi:hypothetical protein